MSDVMSGTSDQGGPALAGSTASTGTLRSGALKIGGVLPSLGAAFMAFVIIYSLATHSLNGVEIAFGFGLALVGLALSFVAKAFTGSAFYSDTSARGGSTS